MRIQVKVPELPLKTFQIPIDEIRVGRDSGNHLRITSDYVGRYHLKIGYSSKDGFKVEDQASKNGTFHEGQRLPPNQPVLLPDNSKLVLGGGVELLLLEDKDFAAKSAGARAILGLTKSFRGALKEAGQEREKKSADDKNSEQAGAVLDHGKLFGFQKYKDLQNLFNKELRNRLIGLEGTRYRVLGLILVTGLSALPAIQTMSMAMGLRGTEADLGRLGFLLPGFFVTLTLVLLVASYVQFVVYRREFKEKVVREIFNFINVDWNYDPEGKMAEGDFKESGIFSESYNSYEGDDLVTGKIGATAFRMSELAVIHKARDKNDSTVVIFKGLFLHLDFNKKIHGETYVLRDFAKSVFGNVLGRAIQSASAMFSYGGRELVSLENPDFEKEFVVYGTDQVEARYILTPKTMESLLHIRKNIGKAFSLAFKNNGVYMAIFFEKGLFEPRLFSSGISFGDMKFIFDLFGMANLLVEELELNTRIWG